MEPVAGNRAGVAMIGARPLHRRDREPQLQDLRFLMITLAVGVLTFYFFAQVTQLSGFGGVNNVALAEHRLEPRPGIPKNLCLSP